VSAPCKDYGIRQLLGIRIACVHISRIDRCAVVGSTDALRKFEVIKMANPR